jgi:hypothetical protein
MGTTTCLARVMAVWRQRSRGQDPRGCLPAYAFQLLLVMVAHRLAVLGLNLVSGQVSIRTGRVGREMHVARKRREHVEVSLRAVLEVKATEQANVVVAKGELATATRRLLAYGSVAEAITGR